MNYSDKLRTAIQEQNVIHARTAILSYLDSDATTAMPQAFRIAVEVADKFTDKDDPFFDQENHILEVPPKTEWNSSLLRKIKAALQTNFSREKLELAEQVIFHLRAQGIRDFQAKQQNAETHSAPKPMQTHFSEKKNTHPYTPAAHPQGGYRTTPIRKSPRNPQSEFLAGAIVGGVALGGAGLIIGLIAGCALKATVSGIVIGGIAGGLVSQKKKRR